MSLSLDGESTVQVEHCLECAANYLLVKSFVLDPVGPRAIVFAALHAHGEVHEAWIDVIFGSFEGPTELDDRVTFGCCVGPVDNSGEPAATAVQAAVQYSDSATFGRKLARSETLAHARVKDFWDVVDFVLTREPNVAHHIYGHLD